MTEIKVTLTLAVEDSLVNAVLKPNHSADDVETLIVDGIEDGISSGYYSVDKIEIGGEDILTQDIYERRN